MSAVPERMPPLVEGLNVYREQRYDQCLKPMGPLGMLLVKTVGQGNRAPANYYLCPADTRSGEVPANRSLFCSPDSQAPARVRYEPQTHIVKIRIALEKVPGSDNARLDADWGQLDAEVNNALLKAVQDREFAEFINFDYPTQRSLPRKGARDLTLYAVVQYTEAGTLLSRPIYITKRLNGKRRDDVLALLTTGTPPALSSWPAYIPREEQHGGDDDDEDDDPSTEMETVPSLNDVENSDWLGPTTKDCGIGDLFIFQRTPLDGTHFLDPDWVSYQVAPGRFLHVNFDPAVRGVQMVFYDPGLYVVLASRQGFPTVMRIVYATARSGRFFVQPSSFEAGAAGGGSFPSYGGGGAGAGPGGAGAGSGGTGSGAGSATGATGSGSGTSYSDFTMLRLLGITGDVIRATNGSTYNVVYPCASAPLPSHLAAIDVMAPSGEDLDISLTSDTELATPAHTTNFPRPSLFTPEDSYLSQPDVHLMAVCKAKDCMATCGGLHEACMHHQCQGKRNGRQCNEVIIRDDSTVHTVAGAQAVKSAFCYTCDKEQPVRAENYCTANTDNSAALLKERFVFKDDPLAIEHGFACSMCNIRHDKMLWLSCGCFVGVGVDRACFFSMMKQAIDERKVLKTERDTYLFVCSNRAHPPVESPDHKVFRLAGNEPVTPGGHNVYDTCGNQLTADEIAKTSANLQHHARQAEEARKENEEKAKMIAHMKRLREENKALKKRIILLETPPAPASPGQQPGTPHAKTASPVQLTPDTPQAHTHAAH